MENRNEFYCSWDGRTGRKMKLESKEPLNTSFSAGQLLGSLLGLITSAAA